jgi:hypothetical protein
MGPDSKYAFFVYSYNNSEKRLHLNMYGDMFEKWAQFECINALNYLP